MIVKVAATANVAGLTNSIPKAKYLSTENDTNFFRHLNRNHIDKVEEIKYLRSLMDAKG